MIQHINNVTKDKNETFLLQTKGQYILKKMMNEVVYPNKHYTLSSSLYRKGLCTKAILLNGIIFDTEFLLEIL